MLTPPVNCIVNNTLVHVMPNVRTLLRFVNAVHLIHSLLDVTPCLVIDQIKVGAIYSHRSAGVKEGVDCKKSHFRVPVCRCAVLQDEEIA